MNNPNLILKVEKYLYRLKAKKNNIEDYYNKNLRNLSIGSKIMY